MNEVQKFKFGQWTLCVNPDRPDDYEMFNLGPNGERRYYRMIPGKYGEPLIDQEPDLAFPVPGGLGLAFFHAKPKGSGLEQMVPTPEDKIIGVVCRNGPRFSLTNAKSKNVDIHVNPDGTIQVGDRAWWLCALFCPDAQRFTPNRWVGFLAAEKPAYIMVYELGELPLWESLAAIVT